MDQPRLRGQVITGVILSILLIPALAMARVGADPNLKDKLCKKRPHIEYCKKKDDGKKYMFPPNYMNPCLNMDIFTLCL